MRFRRRSRRPKKAKEEKKPPKAAPTPPFVFEGQTPKFEINRHKLIRTEWAGGGEWMEVLEVKNPPEGKKNTVVHICRLADGAKHSTFFEFTLPVYANNAFDQSYRERPKKREEMIENSIGFIRKADCGPIRPWFYATTEKIVFNDFAVPVEVHKEYPNITAAGRPLFAKGRRVIVIEGRFKEAKRCIGVLWVKKNVSEFSPDVVTVFWEDGTASTLEWTGNNKSSIESEFQPFDDPI